MPGVVNTSFVLDMQRKLYRWSSNDPDKVFADLFNLVCDRRTLIDAWQRLIRNRGSQTPGTDGMTRRVVEERPGGAQGFLDEICEELRAGTYRPEPVRQRLIPKPGRPGTFRPLGIPTLKDRLVQMALKLILEPIFEADFYPTSYGFRKGRSTHEALAKIQKSLHPTCGGASVYAHVIEGDIKGCFDAIDHHVMMERMRLRVSDRKVLRLIHAFLKAGVMIEGTVRHPVTGSPQGGIISPLLSNIYLTALDERYGRWSMRPRERPQNAADRRHYDRHKGRPIFYMVRYADDFVVLIAGTREQAEAEKRALAEKEVPKGVVASAATPLHSQRSRGTKTLGRWTRAPSLPLGRWHNALPQPGHTDTERMEYGARSTGPEGAARLLAKLQPPQSHLRATRGRSLARAWRAGCLETCTSGSGGGMEKPGLARDPSASSLLYFLLVSTPRPSRSRWGSFRPGWAADAVPGPAAQRRTPGANFLEPVSVVPRGMGDPGSPRDWSRGVVDQGKKVRTRHCG